MTDLVLVRHGETVWHAENRYAGVSDEELAELQRSGVVGGVEAVSTVSVTIGTTSPASEATAMPMLT